MSVVLLFFGCLFSVYNLYKVSKGYLYYAPSLIISLYSFFISLASMNMLQYDFAEYWSNGGVIKNQFIISIYTIFILFGYQFFTLFSELTIGKTRLKYDDFFDNIKIQVSNLQLRFFSIIIFSVTILYLFFIDLNVVWLNNQYLLAQSIDALKYKNNFSIAIQMLIPLIGLLSIIVFALSIRIKEYFSLSVIILPASFYFFLKIGDHSRFSSFYAAVLALFFFISKNKIHKFLVFPFFVFLFFGNLINSLVGRGDVNQGLYSIKNYFDNIIFVFSSADSQIFSNIFEGAFVHGESASYLYYNYPNIFKNLSLSPFPSFIDGYQEHASQYSLRLNEYVPMGATGEILIFGLGYILFYFIIVFLSIRTIILAIKKNKYYIFIFSLLLICLASYLQFTYPVRNVFRFFYLSIIIFYFYDFLSRSRWGIK